MKITFFAVATCVVGLTFSGLSQQSINTSGGDIKSSTGSVSYSVGQVFHETQKSATGSISQGVQQTYTISTMFVNNLAMNLTMEVFPNPTANLLQLKVAGLRGEKLSYKVLGLDGKLIVSEGIEEEITQVDLHTLPSATYFIEVLRDADKLQTFKVVKTN